MAFACHIYSNTIAISGCIKYYSEKWLKVFQNTIVIVVDHKNISHHLYGFLIGVLAKFNE